MFSWARHEHERGCFCCGALGEQGLVGNNGGCGQYHQSPATNCKHCHHPHIANMLIAMLCTVQHIMHYCHSPPKSLTRTRTLEIKNPNKSHNRFNEDRLRCMKVRMWQCRSIQAVRENEADHCTMHGQCNTPCVQFWWKWGEAWNAGDLSDPRPIIAFLGMPLLSGGV